MGSHHDWLEICAALSHPFHHADGDLFTWKQDSHLKLFLLLFMIFLVVRYHWQRYVTDFEVTEYLISMSKKAI